MIQLKVMKNNYKIKPKTVFFALGGIIVLTFVFLLPSFFGKKINTAEALSATKSFGGKIENQPSNGCVDLTSEIQTATYDAIYLTVDKVEIGDPKPADVGILRIWGVAIIPPIVPVGKLRFYNHVNDSTYPIQNTWALGRAFDLTGSDQMSQFSSIGGGSGGVFDISSMMSSSNCSLLANLIEYIGTGQIPDQN